jgi:hypothetical protein
LTQALLVVAATAEGIRIERIRTGKIETGNLAGISINYFRRIFLNLQVKNL